MRLVAVQPYIKVERQVTRTEQIDKKYERMIYLYDEKVVTKHREFSIDQVRDMSYRRITGNNGLLYLHTSHGVYSYTVNTSPEEFIQKFKEIVPQDLH
jgi:hypothetical protein